MPRVDARLACGPRSPFLLCPLRRPRAADDPSELIASLQPAEPVHIFTYSFGAKAGKGAATMKKVACNNGGVWQPVPLADDLTVAMGGYYAYFASGITAPAVRFTEPCGYRGPLWAGWLPFRQAPSSAAWRARDRDGGRAAALTRLWACVCALIGTCPAAHLLAWSGHATKNRKLTPTAAYRRPPPCLSTFPADESKQGMGGLTTASASVFDRAVSPPEFLGVAAVDLGLCEILEAWEGADVSAYLREVSKACAVTTLTACQMER